MVRRAGLALQAIPNDPCAIVSGRVRVTLTDGRRVTGYRKTLRVNGRTPRLPNHLLPDWRLSFPLPADMRFMVLPEGNVPGSMGVSITRIDGVLRALVAGKNREFTIRKAVEFVRGVAPDYRDPINAVINRAADANRSAETHPCQIKIGGRWQSTITFGTSMRSLTW